MITAKDKQLVIIKTVLKPILKNHGYKTEGLTFWKDQGKFFIIINLQNFSWNSKNSVDFCFNIGIALISKLKDPQKKKANYHDCVAFTREPAFLSKDRINTKYRNKVQYSITNDTDIIDFGKEIAFDFENEILLKLDAMNELESWIIFFKDISFWKERLLRAIDLQNNL
jgi:hypothetical protein